MAVRANFACRLIPALKLSVVEGSERPGEAPMSALRIALRGLPARPLDCVLGGRR